MPRQVYCVVRNPYQGIVALLVPNLILFDDSIRCGSASRRCVFQRFRAFSRRLLRSAGAT